ERGLVADHAGAECQHVHIVVLDPLVRRVGVVADGGAHASDLVRRDARPDGAADQDAPLDRAVAHRFADALREVRVVVGRVAPVPAQVDEVVIRPRLADAPEQLALQRGAGMIGGEADPHEWPGSVLPVRSTRDPSPLPGSLALAAPVATASGPEGIGSPIPRPAGWWPGSSVGMRPRRPSRTTRRATSATRSGVNPSFSKIVPA